MTHFGIITHQTHHHLPPLRRPFLPPLILLLFITILIQSPKITQSSPLTTPESSIPLTTSTKTIDDDIITATPYQHQPDPRCPLSIDPHISHNHHHSTHNTPIINSPLLLRDQILVSHSYEHLSSFEHDDDDSSSSSKTFGPRNGFPLLFEGSSFAGGALSYDVNSDGKEDGIVVDYDGRVFVVGLEEPQQGRGSGERFFEEAKVPRLMVRLKWMEEMKEESSSKETEEEDYMLGVRDPWSSHFESEWISVEEEERVGKLKGVSEDVLSGVVKKKQTTTNDSQDEDKKDNEKETNDGMGEPEELSGDAAAEITDVSKESSRRRLTVEDEEGTHPEILADDIANGIGSGDGDDELPMATGYEHDPNIHDDLFIDHGEDMYNFMDDMYYDMEGHPREGASYYALENYIGIDAHVLATPLLFELPNNNNYMNNNNNDFKNMEPILIVPVSYFFDEDQYTRSSKRDTHPITTHPYISTPTNRSRYAASGIAMYGLFDKRWKTQIHLDFHPVTDDATPFLTATPTIASLDNDYHVIAGTRLGYLHVVDATTGSSRKGFPLRVSSPITTPVVAVDMDDDGHVEFLFLDSQKTFYCIDRNGVVLTAMTIGRDATTFRNFKGTLAVGDVDADGKKDVIFTAYDRHQQSYVTLYVLSLLTTKADNGWKFVLNTGLSHTLSIASLHRPSGTSPPSSIPLSLVDLHAHQQHWLSSFRHPPILSAKHLQHFNAQAKAGISKLAPPHGGAGFGLHVIFPTPDGYVYVVDGATGCANRIPVGSGSIGSPLVVGRWDGGALGIVGGTMEGEVMVWGMPGVGYREMNAWKGHGRGDYVHGYAKRDGIVVRPMGLRDNVKGLFVPLSFEILSKGGGGEEEEGRTFLVQVRAGSSAKRVLFQKEYNKTGVYDELVFVMYGPGYYHLKVIMMVDGNRYEDSFDVKYNVNYYEGLEYLILGPLFIVSFMIFFCQKGEREVREDFEENRSMGGILGR